MLSLGLASTRRARLVDPRVREAGLKEEVRSRQRAGPMLATALGRAVAAAGEIGPGWEDPGEIVRYRETVLLIEMGDSATGYKGLLSERRRSVMGRELMRGGQSIGDASARAPASQTPKLLGKSLDMAL